MRRPALALLVAALWMGAATSAEAKIYKYKKPDGTVIYTDKLSDLPADRRAHYNRMEKAAKARRKAQANMLGEKEVARREAEAERKRVMQSQMAEAERQRRLLELDATLKRLRKTNERTASKKKNWQDRMKKAKAKVQELLREFRKTKKEYNQLAIQPNFALLPGQGKKKQALRKKLKELERELDAAINEVDVVIPQQARKAGVPPGWLR